LNLDALYGPCVRRIPAVTAGAKTLYLTFDDGPDPRGTPRVLELLARFDARATFFLIGDRACAHPAIVREILARGHTIGNHSPDHRFGTYFSGRSRLKAWIEAGERTLAEISGAPTVGFRPPAGVRTPELMRAARELGTPIILWQTRFYDSVFAPSSGRLTRTLAKARSGDIVLFHDSQREANLELFLSALRDYLGQAKNLAFQFRTLERGFFHA
jgi:peptidoglycan/xylan/chitin deacetylase (PgdA/CDA1 family)